MLLMSTDLPNVIDRTAYQSQTIVGRNRTIETDSFQTGINNNMLVIAHQARARRATCLKPNLLQMGSSFIVLDTKGTLCREMGTMLAGAGYTVECLDFADICEEPRPLPAGAAHVGYNPLSFIRRDSHGRPNQQDILSIAVALCPVENGKEPFWDARRGKPPCRAHRIRDGRAAARGADVRCAGRACRAPE